MEILHNFFWLIAGILFIAMEVLYIQGFGFLFAGLASICVFLLMEFDVISHEFLADISVFFILTVLWGAVLWIPLKKHSNANKASRLSKIVNSIVVVSGGDIHQNIGQIEWENMKFKAKISPKSKARYVQSGERVIATEIKNDIVYIEPM